MKEYSCEMKINLQNQLGEGPVWDDREGALYWIDGLGCRWFRMKGEEISRYETASPLGSLVLTEDGELYAGMRDGIYHINQLTGKQTLLTNPEAGQTGNRFNDGKVDPRGRYVIGTMSEANNDGSDNGEPAGSLYSVMRDGTWKRLRGSVSISNGLAWNRSGAILYYIDSPTGCVMKYDYDLNTGEIHGGEVCARIPDSEGIPDGMTIDDEGMLWVAQWGGWRVSRFDPRTGERLGWVNVPVKHVTCCCFGGENLDQLFITTSTNAVTGEEWKRQPLAGALFVAETGCRGLPSFRFGEEACT